MKKTGLLFVLAFSALGLAWNNEFGVIPKTFQVQLSGNTVLYSNLYHDGDKASLDETYLQLNLIPTIRVSPVRGIEFNFSYPFRSDEDMKDATGFWGPILGIKYGSPSSAGFLNFVFPAGSKNLLGNGENPSPALIFGGTSFYGNWESFGIRLHSWYFWDFNEHSADELLFLIRPELNLGLIQIGLGFPFEWIFGNSSAWISNTPGTVRAIGGGEDFEYVMVFSIQPKAVIDLGKIKVEPYFSIPLWKYTSKHAFMYYSFTRGVDAKLNF